MSSDSEHTIVIPYRSEPRAVAVPLCGARADSPHRTCLRRFEYRNTKMYSALIALGCLTFIALAGCPSGRDGDTASRPGVVETASEGPVTVTLSVAPAEIDLDEELQLELVVVAPQGVTVDAPYYGSTLREGESAIDFRIVSSQEQLAHPTDDGQLQWVYRFRLAFILPGEYELPGARVSFVQALESTESSSADDSQSASSRRSVETGPIKLTVRADHAPQLTPEELATIEAPSPVELPELWGRWWWGVPVALMAAVVVVVLMRICFPKLYRVLSRWLRRAPEEVVPVPAHEWARAELARLAIDDLIAKGQVKVFYYRVSAILRGYLERRFHVSAPEMTTEEFLVASATGTHFEPATRAELQLFLEACDLVKYARFSPDPDEPGRLVGTVVSFVDRTCVDKSEAGSEGVEVATREERAA